MIKIIRYMVCACLCGIMAACGSSVPSSNSGNNANNLSSAVTGSIMANLNESFAIAIANIQGEVYFNNKILAGNKPILTVDSYPLGLIYADLLGNLYGLGQNGVWEYKNGGVSWQLIGLGNVTTSTIVVDNEQNIFVGTQDGNVYFKPAELSSWHLLANRSSDTNIVQDMIINKNTNDIYFYTRSNNVFRIDHGTHLITKLNSDNFGEDAISQLIIDESGNAIVGTEQGHLWKLIDSQWTVLSHIPGKDTWIIGLQLDTENKVWISSSDGFLYSYDQTKNIWTQESAPDFIFGMHLDESRNNLIICSNDKLGLFKYDIKNSVWKQLGQNLPVTHTTTLAIGINNTYYAVGDNSVFSLSGNDPTWHIMGNTAIDSDRITALDIDKSQNIYAGSDAGNLFKFTKLNAKWQLLGGESIFNKAAVKSIIHDKANNIIASDTAGMVWMFNINLQSWQNLNSGKALDGSPIYALNLDSNDNLYAGTMRGGVWKLTKESSNWILVGSKVIDFFGITSLILDSDNNLYVGAIDSSIFKFENFSWAHLGIPSTIDDGEIDAIYKGDDGVLYVGTSHSNVWRNMGSESLPIWNIVGEKALDGSILNIFPDNNGGIQVITSRGSQWHMANGAIFWRNLGLFGNGAPINRVAVQSLQ